MATILWLLNADVSFMCWIALALPSQDQDQDAETRGLHCATSAVHCATDETVADGCR